MKCFEYIQLRYEGGLRDLCALASHGWHLVAVVNHSIFILERELTEKQDIETTRRFYENINDKTIT